MDAAGKKDVKIMEEAVKSHCNQRRKLIYSKLLPPCEGAILTPGYGLPQSGTE